MGKVFLKRGDVYTLTEGNFNVTQTLDEGIYQTIQNPLTGEILLDRITDRFHFGFKLYGIDETLVTHVIDTYNKQESKHNIGVLLNGAKGTGKTVTAKILANKLGLPIILCDRPYPGLAQFLASINHDCIFFFDEFEKNFRTECGDDQNCAGEDLLSIMDGVYNGDNCHIFILTTNELKVNDNLLSRPSRIRYLKSFGEVIDHKILKEYIDDNLKYPEYREEIIEFIDTLTLATIDIVKSIVDEVNIHKCGVAEFKRFFNVKEATYHYYTRIWQFDLDNNNEPTKKEFIKRASTYAYTPEDSEDYWKPCYNYIRLKKSIKNFKVGELLTDRWKIKEMDLDVSFVLCEDTRYKNQCQYYYFENINTKPSLFDSDSGYNDYGLYDF